MGDRCWREMIIAKMGEHGDSFDNLVSLAMSAPWEGSDHEPSLDRIFDAGFGGAEGDCFTVWTKTRVYFPTEYDGAEGVASVSRDPDGEPTGHV